MSEQHIPRLSTTARYVIDLCKRIIRDVESGECSEDEMNDMLLKTEPRHNGYINPKDYVNADKACKLIGVNRNEFFALLRKYHVKVNKINNQPIGYYVKDVEKIRYNERNKRK